MTDRERNDFKYWILAATALIFFSLCFTGCGTKHVTDPETYVKYDPGLEADEKLGEAIRWECGDLLEEALAEGADIQKLPLSYSERAENGKMERNPLAVALQGRSSPEIIKRLLEAGADTNARDIQRNPLISISEDKEIIQLMLQYGADLTAKDERGKTTLEAYVSVEDTSGDPTRDMTAFLLEQGAAGDASVLASAEKSGIYYIFDLLYLPNKQKFTTMQQKFLEGDGTAANQLLKQTNELDQRDRYLAVIYGNQETIDILEERGINFYSRENAPMSLLLEAIYGGNLETTQAILEKDPDCTEFPREHVKYAIGRNNGKELLAYLVETERLHITRQSDGGKTVNNITEKELCDYIDMDAVDCVSYILEQGYEVSQGEFKGQQLLGSVLQKRETELIKQLMDAGLALNEKESDDSEVPGWVDVCAYADETEILRFFVEHGANLKAYGQAAMQTAIDYYNPEAVKILAAEGVPITRQMYEETMQYSPSDHVKERVKDWYEKQNQ